MLRRGGFVLGAIFGVALVVTCGGSGTTMKTILGDMGFLDDGNTGDGPGLAGDGSPFDIASAQADTSGSRLKVKYMVGSDGTKVPYGGLHDTMLNVDCSWLSAHDGATRCMPLSGAAIDIQSVFSDSGCTQAIVLATKGCVAPVYAYRATPSGGACASSQYFIFSVGAAFTGANYYSKSGANCTTAPTTSLTASYDPYAEGAEVPPSTFVAGTSQTDP